MAGLFVLIDVLVRNEACEAIHPCFAATAKAIRSFLMRAGSLARKIDASNDFQAVLHFTSHSL
jgi:hypothetical protein